MAILYDKQALFAVHAAEEAWEQGYMYMYVRYAPKKSVRTFSVLTGTSSVLWKMLPRVLLLVLTVQYD